MNKTFYTVMLFIMTFLTLSFSQNASARGGMGNADYSDMRSSADRNSNNFSKDSASYRAGEDQGSNNGGGGSSSPVYAPQQDSVDQDNSSIFNSYKNTPN